MNGNTQFDTVDDAFATASAAIAETFATAEYAARDQLAALYLEVSQLEAAAA